MLQLVDHIVVGEKGEVNGEIQQEVTIHYNDAVPVDNVTVEDLDKESFDIFRREAVRSGCMSKDDLNMTNAGLLDG